MAKVMIYDTGKEDSVFIELKKIVFDILIHSNIRIEGKTVLVKPNMLGAFDKERGATTEPILIKAIVEVLEESNAKKIYVGDSPGGAGNGTEGTAKTCGIYEASKGHFYNFGKDVVLVPIKSRFIKNISIASIINNVDVVINVPKLKTHGYMGFSACIKNMFGIVVGPAKAKMHFRASSVSQFGELLIDIYSIRKPDLNIIDAIVVMEGDGPTSGSLRSEHMIIAGTDGVAVDTVVAKIMSFDFEQIKYLTVARKRNIGETSLNNIQIVGQFRTFDHLIKPVTYQPIEMEEDGNSTKPSSRGLKSAGLVALYEMGSMAPKLVRPENCLRCGICANSCPAKAITMVDLPMIDYKKCISCYCCSELCHYNCYDILNNSNMMNDVFTEFMK